MRSFALYGCVLSLLFCCACDEATVNPGPPGSTVKNGQIYYTTVDEIAGTQDVYRINSDGSGKKLIYSDAGLLSAPAAGRLGITRSTSETEGDIALLDLEGTVINSVIKTSGENAGVDYSLFSPAADKVLYRMASNDGVKPVARLHIINADGANDIVLETRAAYNNLPAFSPDGTKVAYFIQGEHDAQSRSRDTLVVVNTDGTGRRQLTGLVNSSDHHLEVPDWSPDGTKIVCLTEPDDEGYDIIVVDVDDAEVHQVTTDQRMKRMPMFSPDGKKIVFCNYTGSGGSTGISIVDIAGTNRRDIMVSAGAPTAYPQWSPDGKKIVVTELNAPKANPLTGTLKIIDVATGSVTALDQPVYRAFWSKK
jgi:Tol biopolymer transport system component